MAAVSATLYPIDVAPGVDVYDPHVSGDIAVYTADAHIRYYYFFSGNNLPIPSPAGATDLLSDVSNGSIVFTRFAGGSAKIMVFDTNAERRTTQPLGQTAASWRSRASGPTALRTSTSTNG